MHSNKPKVLVIPSWYPPNGGYFFVEHARALADQGLQVDVLAGVHRSLRQLPIKNLNKLFKTQIEICGNFREFRRDYWIVPFSEKANFVVWQAMMLQFFEWYKAKYGMPDVVIAHSAIWAGLVASIIWKRFQIPYILVEHRSRFVCNTAEACSMIKPWYVKYLKKAFSNARYVVTVSNSLQPYMKKTTPEIANNLITIHNMVDTDFFRPGSIPLSKRPFSFFALGCLEKIKGMDILLRAFAIIHKAHPGEFRLVIGGSGVEQKNLEAFVFENNLETFIRFDGQLDREAVKSHFADSHAFVLASRFEAFGVVFIEALASGIPVIATHAGGPSEFIGTMQGILVPPEDPIALANAMLQMRDQYHTFDKENIREYAVEMFSKDSVAKRYSHLIQSII